MSQVRTDRMLGRRVLIAEGRSQRPHDFPPAVWPQVSPEDCPFCEGHESWTPEPVLERIDAAGQWQVRVVPNKYPVLNRPARLPEPGERSPVALMPSDVGLSSACGVGAHEVIIESPSHLQLFSQLSVTNMAVALEVYAARLRHWRDSQSYSYGLLFKNLGPQAGASLVHLHSQLVVLDEIPPEEAAVEGRLAEYHQATGDCAICEHVSQEQKIGARVVADSDDLLAYCPFVSLYPYEVWVVPKVHQASFEDSVADSALPLASFLHQVVSILEQLLSGVGYNMLIRTAPWPVDDHLHSHWRVEIAPRMNALAGLELATGLRVNHISPEAAADQLRALVD